MDKELVISSIKQFDSKRVLVVGDVMIDAYYWGNTDRVSPEAPVPVVDVTKKDNRLGGAANVALNLMTLGAEPIICSVIGQDEKGLLFEKLLNKRNFTKEGIIFSTERRTTVKTRIISQDQHLLRVDEEDKHPLTGDIEKEFISRIEEIIDTKKIDVIIFEDYNKGVLTPFIINSIISKANLLKIPTTVDPKKENFFAYQNCTLYKPNFKELKEGLHLVQFDNGFEGNDDEKLDVAIRELTKRLNCSISFVTLSEHGVIIMEEGFVKKFPAFKRKIIDVSGAGDTVISVASLALATGLKAENIAQISNLAGGWVCEKIGVTPINQKELISEINRLF